MFNNPNDVKQVILDFENEHFPIKICLICEKYIGFDKQVELDIDLPQE